MVFIFHLKFYKLYTKIYGRALKFHESCHHSENLESAARIAGKLGDKKKETEYYRKAMNLAENEGIWERAFNIAVKLKEKEKATIYKSALGFTNREEMQEKKDNFKNS